MPVEDPVLFGDQVRHDDSATFCEIVNFMDRQNLIRSKQLSNRAQDKADLELLLSEK
jgi:hypothetical protein